jgi:hypothetical protein
MDAGEMSHLETKKKGIEASLRYAMQAPLRSLGPLMTRAPSAAAIASLGFRRTPATLGLQASAHLVVDVHLVNVAIVSDHPES